MTESNPWTHACNVPACGPKEVHLDPVKQTIDKEYVDHMLVGQGHHDASVEGLEELGTN